MDFSASCSSAQVSSSHCEQLRKRRRILIRLGWKFAAFLDYCQRFQVGGGKCGTIKREAGRNKARGKSLRVKVLKSSWKRLFKDSQMDNESTLYLDLLTLLRWRCTLDSRPYAVCLSLPNTVHPWHSSRTQPPGNKKDPMNSPCTSSSWTNDFGPTRSIGGGNEEENPKLSGIEHWKVVTIRPLPTLEPTLAASCQLLFNMGLFSSSAIARPTHDVSKSMATFVELKAVHPVTSQNCSPIPLAKEVRLLPVHRYDTPKRPFPEWLFKLVREWLEGYFNCATCSINGPTIEWRTADSDGSCLSSASLLGASNSLSTMEAKRGRLVHDGDIITIALPTILCESAIKSRAHGAVKTIGGAHWEKWKRLYFKVSLPFSADSMPECEAQSNYPNVRYVHPSYTKCIFLEGQRANSFVPPTISPFPAFGVDPDAEDYFIPTSIAALSACIRQDILHLLEPTPVSMTGTKMENFGITPVLLIVASMHQQSLLLNYLAELMGVSLVVKDCWSYRLGQSEQQLLSIPPGKGRAAMEGVEAKLAKVFQKSMAHAPAILWLRNTADALGRKKEVAGVAGELSSGGGGHDCGAELIVEELKRANKKKSSPPSPKSSSTDDSSLLGTTGSKSPFGYVVVLSCTSEEELSTLPVVLKQMVHFRYELEKEALSERERSDYYAFESCLLSGAAAATSADGRQGEGEFHRWFVNSTRGFSLVEMERLISDACIAAALEKGEKLGNVGVEKGADWQPSLEHVEQALDKRNARLAASYGALHHASVPQVRWEDVGGLDEAKQLLLESIRAMVGAEDDGCQDGNVGCNNIRSSPMAKAVMRRSGLLLFGPPGCGKTLLAKAVASELKLAFISVKGPELLSRYVGESEHNLREVFRRAHLASPCIIFFDELDSLAPRRGVSGDSGGVMDRMVSQLLTEMDTLQWRSTSEGSGGVFVIGATNRPDLLDECLLKPGRFDVQVEVRPAESVEAKERILRPICAKIKALDSELTPRRIAELCPVELVSGAALAAMMSKAGMAAVRERIQALMEKQGLSIHSSGLQESTIWDSDIINEDAGEIVIEEKHLLEALDEYINKEK